MLILNHPTLHILNSRGSLAQLDMVQLSAELQNLETTSQGESGRKTPAQPLVFVEVRSQIDTIARLPAEREKTGTRLTRQILSREVQASWHSFFVPSVKSRYARQIICTQHAKICGNKPVDDFFCLVIRQQRVHILGTLHETNPKQTTLLQAVHTAVILQHLFVHLILHSGMMYITANFPSGPTPVTKFCSLFGGPKREELKCTGFKH